MVLRLNKKAQSILDYAVLVAIISAAIVAMHTYLYRAIQGKLKQVQDELYEAPEPGVEVPQTPRGGEL